MKERPIVLSANEVRAVLSGTAITKQTIRRCEVGDIFWARETWADVHPLQVAEGRYSQPGQAGIPGPPGVSYQTIYRTDGEYPPIWPSHDGHPYRALSTNDPLYLEIYPRGTEYGWNPSSNMPRWASRLTLAVRRVNPDNITGVAVWNIDLERKP